ncbi:protein of unknown function (plasmid) [Caballeronia sp. S22]
MRPERRASRVRRAEQGFQSGRREQPARRFQIAMPRIGPRAARRGNGDAVKRQPFQRFAQRVTERSTRLVALRAIAWIFASLVNYLHSRKREICDFRSSHLDTPPLERISCVSVMLS